MNTERPQLASPRGNRDLMTAPIAEAIEAFTPQFKAALPDNIPVSKFTRVLVTALNQNRDLARCDRHSLFLAAVKCAQDGLYPDGREAALVPYGGVVQYMPMVTGYRRLMANEVIVVTTEVVYSNDKFSYTLGDDASIEHEPPPLDQDRGEPIGAYCSIRLKKGGYIREVMPKKEIERIRTLYSKAKRDDSPWSLHWGEMARKTVLKRAGKQIAFSPEISRVFEREDEAPGLASAVIVDHEDRNARIMASIAEEPEQTERLGDISDDELVQSMQAPAPRRRGRPPGAKNASAATVPPDEEIPPPETPAADQQPPSRGPIDGGITFDV
jgi:recombination protein RecT